MVQGNEGLINYDLFSEEEGIERRESFGTVSGGGIFVTGTVADIRNSTIADNLAEISMEETYIEAGDSNMFSAGGGALLSASHILVADSAIYGNRAYSHGSFPIAGDLPSIILNLRALGGGLSFEVPGETKIVSSTISGNQANLDVSGFVTIGGEWAHGGGIYFPGTISETAVEHSTIADNEVEIASLISDGPSFFSYGGGGMLANGEIEIDHALIGDNVLTEDFGSLQTISDDIDTEFGATVTANYSLIEAPQISIGGANNIFNEDPVLGPLANNGGTTLTHALMPDSPALDAGDPAYSPSNLPTFEFNSVIETIEYDQRGAPFDRVTDGGPIDIGAIEQEAAPEEPCPIGDYNDDGKVSAADFTVWQDNLGAPTLLNRDPNNTGPVDLDDFESWKAHYGETCESEATGFAAKAMSSEMIDLPSLPAHHYGAEIARNAIPDLLVYRRIVSRSVPILHSSNPVFPSNRHLDKLMLDLAFQRFYSGGDEVDSVKPDKRGLDDGSLGAAEATVGLGNDKQVGLLVELGT